jgi:uncharacterized protein
VTGHDHGGHQHGCTPALSEQDTRRLESLLEARRGAGLSAMGIDTAHGFLTAVVSGPRLILPLEWLPRILGGGEPAEGTDGLQGLLTAMYRDIAHELDHGHFGPLVTHQRDADGGALPLPHGWCQGYAVGLNLHGEEAIDAAGEDPVARGALELIAGFLAVADEERLAPADPAAHRRTAGHLGEAATALYRWWRDGGNGPAAVS